MVVRIAIAFRIKARLVFQQLFLEKKIFEKKLVKQEKETLTTSFFSKKN
jgi:hypothetical protein